MLHPQARALLDFIEARAWGCSMVSPVGRA